MASAMAVAVHRVSIPMRILITGVTGFVGGYLVECLLGHGHEIQGLSRRNLWTGELSHLANDVHHYSIDLNDQIAVENLLSSVRPEWIFHLAGYANPGQSFRECELAWKANWEATFHLYQAIASCGQQPRVLFASSGLTYGTPRKDQPCRETDALYPASPYAASKAAAEMLSFQVVQSPGLDVIRVRCFNQIGPRQSAHYAIANFARQIAAVECGLQAPILETGDLSAQRDLTDVRDMVRALVLLMEHGKAGEVYNAGSGTTISMQLALDRMLAMARTPIDVRQRFDPMRRADTTICRADIDKLRQATGWQPEISLERSMADILNYWRQQTVRMERSVH